MARDRIVTTNSVEGYFGNMKHSIDGTHHHVSHQHLPLYIAAFDYKYNTRGIGDGERTVAGLGQIEGRRLTLNL